MKLFISVLFTIISLFCQAQSITGTVVDSDGHGIAFANVVLYQSSDSSIVAGCTSDDNGNFFIRAERAEGLYLRV